MKRMRAIRETIMTAIVLVLASAIFGLWMDYAGGQSARLQTREDYAEVFTGVAQQREDAGQTLERRLAAVVTSNRATDTHTHAANLAIVLILYALLASTVTLRRPWALRALTAGALIYSAGLGLQYAGATLSGEAVAAAGAVLVVIFAAVLAVDALRATNKP